MAYIRSGRPARSGRGCLVPGSAACAAIARRFPLTLAPLRFVSADDGDAASSPASPTEPQARLFPITLTPQPAG